MARIAAIVTLAGLCGAPALADEAGKTAAMHHVATVLASTRLCPALEMNSSRLAALTLANGFSFSADSAEGRLILADARYQIESMKAMPEKEVCAGALLLYGEAGLNVPGLLREK